MHLHFPFASKLNDKFNKDRHAADSDSIKAVTSLEKPLARIDKYIFSNLSINVFISFRVGSNKQKQ